MQSETFVCNSADFTWNQKEISENIVEQGREKWDYDHLLSQRVSTNFAFIDRMCYTICNMTDLWS